MTIFRNGLSQPGGVVASPLTSTLDAGSQKVTNLSDGTASGDAVNFGQLNGAGTITGVKTFSVAFKVATYTVATLPTATVRQVAFASDGRKVGEGSGSGTGTLVYADGTAWRRCGDDTTVVS